MLEVKINNVEIPVQKKSFSISKNITSKVDTCSFIYLKTGDRTYVPKVFDDVEVFDDAEKVFAGVITEFDDSVQGSDLLTYRVLCTDYTFLFDRKLVAETYENETVSDIIEDIVANFTDGFTTNNVENLSTNIEFIQFDYTRPSDALRDIADSVGYDWYVDYDKDIYFFPRGSRLAPFNVTDDTNYEWKSLKLKKSGKQMKNVIYIIGSDYVGDEIEDKVGEGDGKQKRFNLPYRYDKQPTVKLGGVSKTVGIEFLSDSGSFDCYWNSNEKVISFPTAPASGDVDIKGKPLIPLFVKVKAPNNVDGEFEFKIIDKTLKTEEAVRARAKVEIDTYAKAVDSANFITQQKGLEVGQKIKVDSTIRGIDNEKYIIQTITLTVNNYNKFKYNVKLSNVKAYEIIEFMRMLLRKGEKEFGIVRNPTSILNTITTLFDSFNVSTEELKVRNNFEYTWVWGAYTTTSINDTVRSPSWNCGTTWL